MAAMTMRQAGNSLAVTIPKRDRERKHWDASTKLEVVDHPEGLLLRPVRKKLTLEDMLRGVRPGMLPPPIDVIAEGNETP